MNQFGFGEVFPVVQIDMDGNNHAKTATAFKKLRGHVVIPLDEIDRYRTSGAAEMCQELTEKGWCFVKLPSKLPSLTQLTNELTTFFSKDVVNKSKHSAPFGFGYSEVPHKEGVRVLTGYRLSRDFIPNNFVPQECKESLEKLSRALDTLTMSISLALAQPLFQCSPPALAKRADIPVAYGMHFGMLDAAHYFNKKTVQHTPPIGSSVDEVNCVPHYDPGLLSISILSTQEGLQLRDPRTEQWVDGPVNTREGEEDIGVIWLGEAAVTSSKNTVKAGIHRVVYPQVASPRITVWYEMCTIKQATEPDENYLTPGEIQVPNMPGSDPMQVDEGSKKIDILRKIERTRGVPMSKVMRLDDSFHSFSFGGDDSDE